MIRPLSASSVVERRVERALKASPPCEWGSRVLECPRTPSAKTGTAVIAARSNELVRECDYPFAESLALFGDTRVRGADGHGAIMVS